LPIGRTSCKRKQVLAGIAWKQGFGLPINDTKRGRKRNCEMVGPGITYKKKVVANTQTRQRKGQELSRLGNPKALKQNGNK